MFIERFVANCILCTRGRILLLQRRKDAATYQERWTAITGSVPEFLQEHAEAQIKQALGLPPSQLTLVRSGEPIDLVDQLKQMRWTIRPYLYSIDSLEQLTLHHDYLKYELVDPRRIARLNTVPMLQETLDRVWDSHYLGPQILSDHATTLDSTVSGDSEPDVAVATDVQLPLGDNGATLPMLLLDPSEGEGSEAPEEDEPALLIEALDPKNTFDEGREGELELLKKRPDGSEFFRAGAADELGRATGRSSTQGMMESQEDFQRTVIPDNLTLGAPFTVGSNITATFAMPDGGSQASSVEVIDGEEDPDDGPDDDVSGASDGLETPAPPADLPGDGLASPGPEEPTSLDTTETGQRDGDTRVPQTVPTVLRDGLPEEATVGEREEEDSIEGDPKVVEKGIETVGGGQKALAEEGNLHDEDEDDSVDGDGETDLPDAEEAFVAIPVTPSASGGVRVRILRTIEVPRPGTGLPSDAHESPPSYSGDSLFDDPILSSALLAFEESELHISQEMNRKALELLQLTGDRSAATSARGWYEDVCRSARELAKLRPSLAAPAHAAAKVLFELAFEMDKMAVDTHPTELRDILIRTVSRVTDDAFEATSRLADHVSQLIPPGASIMTLSYSPTVLEGLKRSKQFGIQVMVPESRPHCEGRQMARAVHAMGRGATVITDAAIGIHMREVDLVIIGATAILSDGSIIYKTGAYPLALAAKAARAPFYVAATMEKLDLRPDASKSLVFEEKDSHEVWSEPDVGIDVRNVYFERVPRDFITGIITEDNLVDPSSLSWEVKARRHLHEVLTGQKKSTRGRG